MSGETLELHRVRHKALLDVLPHPPRVSPRKWCEVQLGVLVLLASVRGEIVSMDNLVDWLWGDSPNGGPDDPKRNIAIAIGKLRGRGVPIKTHGWRGYSYDPWANPHAA